MKACLRCGQDFDPEVVASEMKWKPKTPPRHCVTCMVRNVIDALDMPMPPELLDKFSKHPTLTKREYRQKLKTESD